MQNNNTGVNEIQPSKVNELQAVNDYLNLQPAIALAVEVALNIYRPNLCRRQRTLEKWGYLMVINKVKCPITNRLAWLLTCDLDLFPIPSQLNLF